jgi:MoaA/NifB/PqqE/SkfB family radical SAM enzyme
MTAITTPISNPEVAAYLGYLPLELRQLMWRAHPLDGKLLLFDRDSGLNILLEGDETQHFQRAAPRTLLIAVTNACNLTCAFCYRDLKSRSEWRYDTLLRFCQDADHWGVLEVAFGGGEPMLFPDWQAFINEVYETTGLCINFTTNGTLLTRHFLERSAGKYGQIRVSLYEDNDWPTTLALLTHCQARFGVNWLMTPAELDTIDRKFQQLLSLGVRDFLLLSYKGSDAHLHLTPDACKRLSAFVNRIHQQFGATIQLKLDICWGDSLPTVPRLFTVNDCAAADEFLSITSDKRVKVCSFQPTHTGIPFETIDDVRTIWEQRRHMRQAAQIGGCARLPNRGLPVEGTNSAYIELGAIQ